MQDTQNNYSLLVENDNTKNIMLSDMNEDQNHRNSQQIKFDDQIQSSLNT